MPKLPELRISYTWITVAALIIAIVTTQFSEDFYLWQRLIMGVVVTLLFLLGIIIREIIFNLTIFRLEKSHHRVILFAFGGAPELSLDRQTPGHLPLLYTARFLYNLVIAVIFYGLFASFINAGNSTLAGLAQWLSYIHFLLFVLHLVPAFPLDGGQVLRLWLWRKSGDYYQATRIASLAGFIIGWLLIFSGVMFFILTMLWMSALLMVVVGWTIQTAAGYTRREVLACLALQKITASEVMLKDFPSLAADVKVGQTIHEHVLLKGWRYIVVMQDSEFKGIATLTQIKRVPVKLWSERTIGDIMTPSVRCPTSGSTLTGDILYEDMRSNRLICMPVLEGQNVVGVVTLESLQNVLNVRRMLGV